MSGPHQTQDVVSQATKLEAAQGVSAPLGWCCELCFDHERGEPLADSLTPETRRFVGWKVEAAIDELRRLDPRRRHAVWLAIEGLREVREELGL